MSSIYGVLSYGSAVIAKKPELVKRRLGFNFYIRLYEEMKDERYLKQAKRYESPPNLLVSNDGVNIFYDFLLFSKETELVDDGINLVLNELLKKIFDDESVFTDFQNQTDFIVEKRGLKEVKRITWDIDSKEFKNSLNKIDLSFTLSKKGEISAELFKDGKKILEKIIS